MIYLWGGQPFLKGAVAEVRDRQPGMMLPTFYGQQRRRLQDQFDSCEIADEAKAFWGHVHPLPQHRHRGRSTDRLLQGKFRGVGSRYPEPTIVFPSYDDNGASSL